MNPALTNDCTSQTTCANFLGRTILASLQEILGKDFYTTLLRVCGSEDWLNSLPPDNLGLQFPLQRLERLFFALGSVAGEKAQRGLLQRSGRACFYSLQRRSTPSLDIFTPQVLTLPKALKVKRCGEILAGYFHRYMGCNFFMEPLQGGLKWGYKLSCGKADLVLGNGFAELWGGFWYELLYTLSGGKPHLIEITMLAGEKQPAWVIYLPYLPFEG